MLSAQLLAASTEPTSGGWYDTVLFPFKWVTAWVLVGIHRGLTMLGLPEGPGITWVLSIVVLTIFVRLLIIPLFIKQIKSTRGMSAIQPEIKKIQEKYKGRNDQVSKQQMSQETMNLYKQYGVNPMASCFPLLIQLPILAALYRVLWQMPLIASKPGAHIGGFDSTLAAEMDKSTVFGVYLSDTFTNTASNPTTTKILIIVSVLLYAGLMFFQQFINMKHNMNTSNAQQMRMMKMMVYLMPLMTAWFGFIVQIGVLVYLVVTMVVSFIQQIFVMYYLPTPGSAAHDAQMRRHQVKYDSFKEETLAEYNQKLMDLGLSGEDVAKALRLEVKATRKGEDDPFSGIENGEKLREGLALYKETQEHLHQKAQDLELEEKPKKPVKQSKMMAALQKKAEQQQAGMQPGVRNAQAQPKRLTRAQRDAQAKRRRAAGQLSDEEKAKRRQARRNNNAGKKGNHNR